MFLKVLSENRKPLKINKRTLSVQLKDRTVFVSGANCLIIKRAPRKSQYPRVHNFNIYFLASSHRSLSHPAPLSHLLPQPPSQPSPSSVTGLNAFSQDYHKFFQIVGAKYHKRRNFHISHLDLSWHRKYNQEYTLQVLAGS